MIVNDTNRNRMIFWIVYSCYIPIITLYNLFFWIAPSQDEAHRNKKGIEEYCIAFGEKNGWGEDGAHSHYFSQIECEYEENHDLIRS